MDRLAELTTRFNAIDTNANGTLDKSELSAVFGDIHLPLDVSLSRLAAVCLLLPCHLFLSHACRQPDSRAPVVCSRFPLPAPLPLPALLWASPLCSIPAD